MTSSRKDKIEEYYIISPIYTFKVSVILVKHFRDSSKLLHTELTVRSNYDKCVNIIIPLPDEDNSKELKLSWKELQKNKYNVNKEIIKGTTTVEMVRLALFIAQKIAPYTEYATIDDMSFFYCDTPLGVEKTTLPPFYIALYGKSWYEDKFNATMTNKNDYAKYKQSINSMSDYKFKPDYFKSDFNFGNNQVENILLPLYIKTNTWVDFFKSIINHYPQDKYILMYPWLENIIKMIFRESGGDSLYSGMSWTIDLKNIPEMKDYKVNSELNAKFDKYADDDYMTQYDRYRWVNYQDALDWDIKKAIKKHKMKYTRKNKKSHRKTQRKEEMF
jgi:hypothetical protein